MNKGVAYDILADVGKGYAMIGMITGLVIGLVFIIVGIFFVLKKKNENQIIIDPFQKPNDPPYSLIGWILITIGFFIAFLSWLNYFITAKYKPIAAIRGAGDIIGEVRQDFAPLQPVPNFPAPQDPFQNIGTNFQFN